MPWWPWKDASERLSTMIRRAEDAIKDPKMNFGFRIVQKAAPVSPIVVASHIPSVLLGPDGKPLQEVS